MSAVIFARSSFEKRSRERSGSAISAPDKYSLQVPNGLAFAEFKGYEDWQAVSVSLSEEAQAKLFGFDHAGWSAEFDSIGEYLREYGPRMPQALHDEQQRIAAALKG